MAYVSSRAGYRSKPRMRGMGAASCPSIEQLMGITDSSDPCQSSSQCFDASGNPIPCGGAMPGLTIVNPASTVPLGPYAGSTPGTVSQVCYTSTGAQVPAGPSGECTGSSFNIASLMPWLIGAGVLGALYMVSR